VISSVLARDVGGAFERQSVTELEALRHISARDESIALIESKMCAAASSGWPAVGWEGGHSSDGDAPATRPYRPDSVLCSVTSLLPPPPPPLYIARLQLSLQDSVRMVLTVNSDCFPKQH
jgi:hypothetical protein